MVSWLVTSSWCWRLCFLHQGLTCQSSACGCWWVKRWKHDVHLLKIIFSPSHHKDEQNLESEVVTSSLREQLLETWVCLPVNVLIDFFTDCPHPPHFFISHHPKMLCIWTVIATINVICIWKNLPEAWSSNCELLLEISHQVCSLTTVKKRKCLSKILKLTDGWSRSFQTPEVFTNFLKRDMCACVCIYVYFYTLIQYLQNWVLF